MLPILLFLLILLQSHIQIAICKKHDTQFFNICPSSRCSESGPEIRFPYRINTSSKSCGVHGMELTCSPDKDTILTLPNLGTAIVQTIDYKYGYVTVKLGNSWPSCLLTNQTMMNVTTLLYSSTIDTVSIITCPKTFTLNAGDLLTGPVLCLSSSGKYIYVVSADESMDKIPSSCMVLQSGINILQTSYVDENSDRSTTWKVTVDDFLGRRLVTLKWSQTNITQNCLGCEQRGRQCGYDLARNEAFCKPHGNNLNFEGFFLTAL